MRSIAILGGTFDPIHFGHLRPALELSQLGFDEVRLMPCHVPAHRSDPHCSARQRLEMVELAVASEPRLSVDQREIDRQGETYTVDTLTQLRDELGGDVSLNLVMGMDAFRGLNTWHQWEGLAHLANIVVTERPGFSEPTEGVVGNFLHARKAHTVEDLLRSASGRVLVMRLSRLDISATAIRDLIRVGKSPRYLLPDSVWDYIEQNRLYGLIE